MHLLDTCLLHGACMGQKCHGYETGGAMWHWLTCMITAVTTTPGSKQVGSSLWKQRFLYSASFPRSRARHQQQARSSFLISVGGDRYSQCPSC